MHKALHWSCIAATIADVVAIACTGVGNYRETMHPSKGVSAADKGAFKLLRAGIEKEALAYFYYIYSCSC